MYSLTETGIHLLVAAENGEPQVKLECRCKRRVLQEQVYTCINCSGYSCHYCTVPEFSSHQCRACKRIYQNTLKNSKCSFCFACPFCQNVLNLSRDPRSKLYIYHCQFCFWNSKEINMKDERPQILQDNLCRLSSLKEGENRIYNTACTFFKETNIAVEVENQALKYTHNKRPSLRASIEEASLKDKQQLKKFNQGIETLIRHSSLDDDSEEYAGNEGKYPQALPLLTKKTRRCPDCAKPLTNIYRPVVSNEPNVELMHKDLKIMQAQRLPAVDGKVTVRFLKNCLLGQRQYKPSEQEQLQVNRAHKVVATIQNKRKNVEVTYHIIIEPYERKK